MAEKTLHVLVEGLVQGVFFRKFVKESATALGVRGFVRNLADGRVEAFCQGSDRALGKMLEKLKVGPPGAKVEKVVFEKTGGLQKFDSFEVRF